MMAMPAFVSVVIPSYNGIDTICRCIESLLGQKSEASLEVIVVDSSSDATPEVIPKRYPQIKFVHHKQQTPAPQARNEGIELAQGDLIGMLDQDCIADPGWLSGMVKSHHENDCAAVMGGIRPDNPRALMGLAGFLVEFSEFSHLGPRRVLQHFATCNVTLKRKAIEEYGLLPDDIWPADDTIWSRQMFEAGEKILFEPQLTIAHRNRTSWSKVLQQQRLLGEASAVARRRLPILPASWMARYPVTVAIVPLARPLRSLGRFLCWTPLHAVTLALLYPLLAANCTAWAMGFWQGARQPELSG